MAEEHKTEQANASEKERLLRWKKPCRCTATVLKKNANQSDNGVLMKQAAVPEQAALPGSVKLDKEVAPDSAETVKSGKAASSSAEALQSGKRSGTKQC